MKSCVRPATATGLAPSRADLVGVAREHGADPDGVLGELAERDVVLFDADGEVRAAYPFLTQLAHAGSWSTISTRPFTGGILLAV